jgi:hypothetical protein
MNAIEHATPASGSEADRAQRQRVETLLSRYPSLTDPEIHEVLLFLRKGKALEIGFLSSNEALKPKLERFRADHARDLSLGKRELLIACAVMLAILAAVALLWNAGVRH